MAGTLVANTINTDTGLFSTNNAYSGIAKAWVSYSATPSTCTILTSFNVSSVTYNGTGDHTVNFTTAFASANYSASGMAQAGSSGEPKVISVQYATAPTASALRICIQNDGGTLKDSAYNFVQVHGN